MVLPNSFGTKYGLQFVVFGFGATKMEQTHFVKNLDIPQVSRVVEAQGKHILQMLLELVHVTKGRFWNVATADATTKARARVNVLIVLRDKA